jgi:type I restriction enzyme S subunit
MSFPRYSAYKDSGVEWLGEVPEHWEVKRIASLYREVVEQGSDELPVLSVSIHHGVSDSELSEEEMDRKVTRSEDRSKYKRVSAGDLVYNMMRAWQGAFGTVCVEGMVSPAYVVARPTSNVPSTWIEYLLRTDPAISEIKRFSRGITDFRLRLYWDEFKNLRVCLPPSSERGVLLRFLDRETAKIDALIAEQQRLIDLAKERIKTLALSGYQCPSSTQERIGRLVKQISRPVAISDEMIYEPLGLYNRGRGLFHKEVRAGTEMGDSDFFLVEDGDLILSGQFAWEGAVALASSDESGCVVSHRYPVIRGRSDRCLTEFLLALLWTDHGDFLLNQSSRGAAGRNRPLNLDLLLKEEIRVPDLSIQELIKSLVWKLRALQEECTSQQNLASEHKKALISAAVTGQIDVRGLVPEASAA